MTELDQELHYKRGEIDISDEGCDDEGFEIVLVDPLCEASNHECEFCDNPAEAEAYGNYVCEDHMPTIRD